jgi:hypothetical protein
MDYYFEPAADPGIFFYDAGAGGERVDSGLSVLRLVSERESE